MNRAGTRIGRATWLYFGLWALLLIVMNAISPISPSDEDTFFAFLAGFAVLSLLILLLNRLDTSGPTKEEFERAKRELAAKKEAVYLATEKSKWSYRLGKWVRHHKGLMKIVGILGTRLGRFSLAGWIGIIIVIAVLGAIYYQRTQYTNRKYLKELIESHMIEKAASQFIAGARKAESEKGSNTDWKVVEDGLSSCMVKEANRYLESSDPYLLERANKITPQVLAARFLKSCGAIE